MPTRETTKSRYQARNDNKVWTEVERSAMRDSARERKAQAKLTSDEARAAGEAEVQAKIAELPAADRAMAGRIHEIVTSSAPSLVPKTYYGMPAYAKDGKVICFFQSKSKFKVRYSTFGFQPDANIDDGELFPVAFAVTELTPRAEARIVELVQRAVS